MLFPRNLFNRKKHSASIEPQDEETILSDRDLEGDTDGTSEEEKGDASLSGSEEDDIEYELVEREILPSKIICPDCGGITLEGLDFCDKCGGEL